MRVRDRQEVREGIKLWLETRQNQALFSDKSPCETIEELLVDLATCHEFPWETMLNETDLYYRKPNEG